MATPKGNEFDLNDVIKTLINDMKYSEGPNFAFIHIQDYLQLFPRWKRLFIRLKLLFKGHE